jgi:flavodoxin
MLYDISALDDWCTTRRGAFLVQRVEIVYATKTKHSKKIAEALSRALNVSAHNVTDNPRIAESELLFIIGGIYGGDSLPELLNFVQGLNGQKTPKVALITSCASKKQGQERVRRILEEKGIDVVDELLCQGSFLLYKWGRPNRVDLQEAVDFAVRLQERL